MQVAEQDHELMEAVAAVQEDLVAVAAGMVHLTQAAVVEVERKLQLQDLVVLE